MKCAKIGAKLLGPKFFNPGNHKEMAPEREIDDITFTIHKFSNRPKPESPDDVHYISNFSEFGCESVGVMYNIPIVVGQNQGKYSIALGWYGREYLYRHLVDEFWELDQQFMWLRDYARAFHHVSKNLKKLESSLRNTGFLTSSENLGKIAVGNTCAACNYNWGQADYAAQCPKCGSKEFSHRSLFSDIKNWKAKAKPLPRPCQEKLDTAAKYLKPNPVGIFARGRKTYGRNLQPEFYIKLINLLERKGYNPIWLGERQSTLECPVDHIVDFSRMEEARDLELTLAIICQLKFTVQFWTASTRFAGMMGVPYMLFESPDQIWGNGQEGFRRNLCDFGNRKLVAAHFLNVYNDNDRGLSVVERAIQEMNEGNWEDIVDMVENYSVVEGMRRGNELRIGG